LSIETESSKAAIVISSISIGQPQFLGFLLVRCKGC